MTHGVRDVDVAPAVDGDVAGHAELTGIGTEPSERLNDVAPFVDSDNAVVARVGNEHGPIGIHRHTRGVVELWLIADAQGVRSDELEVRAADFLHATWLTCGE